MFKFIKTTTHPLTITLAKEFSEMAAPRGERPLKTRRLTFLGNRIRDGKFHTPKWSTAILDGSQYRIDGQHSSRSLVDSDGWFPKGLVAVIDEYTCETSMDLADLFAQFDSPESKRTNNELVLAHARQFPELDELNPQILAICASGVSFALTRARGLTAGDSEDRARVIQANRSFVLWAAPIADSSKDTRRVGVIGAMFATYQRGPDKADVFWKYVSNEGHNDRDNATRVLARYLLSLTLSKRGNLKTKEDLRSVYSRCIHAWNAYQNNKTTMLYYKPSARIPRPI